MEYRFVAGSLAVEVTKSHRNLCQDDKIRTHPEAKKTEQCVGKCIVVNKQFTFKHLLRCLVRVFLNK